MQEQPAASKKIKMKKAEPAAASSPVTIQHAPGRLYPEAETDVSMLSTLIKTKWSELPVDKFCLELIRDAGHRIRAIFMGLVLFRYLVMPT
jgi:hypothetical protein